MFFQCMCYKKEVLEILFSHPKSSFYNIQKMFNLNDISNENNKDHKEKWPHTPDHAYEILIIGNYGSGKTNALLNLTKEQDNIDKIYLYTKNLNEPKYEFLITKGEYVGIKHLNDSKAFIECLNTMDDFYESIIEDILSRKRKTLIVFDDISADII